MFSKLLVPFKKIIIKTIELYIDYIVLFYNICYGIDVNLNFLTYKYGLVFLGQPCRFYRKPGSQVEDSSVGPTTIDDCPRRGSNPPLLQSVIEA